MRFFIILFLQINLVLSVTIISTWSNNFRNATAKAFEATTASNYMFGLVEGLSTCERLQCDTTVGWGGSPDENGETTLDAMVMDGMTMNVGAVANLRRVRDAAKVAWAVANYTKHTLLTGDLATEFAKKMGFKEVDLSSNGSKQTHQDWLNNNCQPNFWRNVQPDPNASCGPYTPTKLPNKKMSKSMNVDIHNHDTIGMVVLDNENKISAGTSSNGATHKIPGRVGDAPIPGAGAYATSIGGAAATGDGDIMMRFLPSFYIVHEMELGSKPQTACKNVIKRILKFFPDFQGGVVALHHTGVIGASCANLEHFPVSFTTNGTIVTRLYQCLKPVSRFE